jgi:hypothetical protein
VARYGGEEFVVLCADCDNATATNRAERVREELARTPQTALDNRPITASFGVTEIQAGDTPETMLRRADRALLRAKESGRNRVVQLGTGIPQDTEPSRRWDWRRWFRPIPSHHLVEETLITAVPLAVTMEKLRGFVSDHHAEIVATEDGKMRLQVTKRAAYRRRNSDRPVSFILSLQFLEQRLRTGRSPTRSASRTIIHVTIQLADNRDRRRDHSLDGARHLFASLKSYFMAQTFDGSWELENADADSAFLGRLLAIVARWGHAPVR